MKKINKTANMFRFNYISKNKYICNIPSDELSTLLADLNDSFLTIDGRLFAPIMDVVLGNKLLGRMVADGLYTYNPALLEDVNVPIIVDLYIGKAGEYKNYRYSVTNFTMDTDNRGIVVGEIAID